MRLSVSVSSLLTIQAVAGAAWAFVPSQASGPPAGVLEVAAGSPVRTHVDIARIVPALRAAAFNRFLFVEGGQWEGLWDAQTNVPLTIMGSGIAAPGTVVSAAEAQRFVEAFLVKHVGLLAPGSAASDLHIVDNISDGEMRTVSLEQTYQGMPVLGASLIFEFKNDRLFVMGSTAMPNVKVPLGRPLPGAKSANA